MKRSALLIGLFGVTGAATLWLSYSSLPDWVGWRQVPVVLLAVALQSVSVDLFTYHHKTPGVIAPSERRALTAGLAGTFLVLGLYGTEVAVFTALMQAIASAFLIRSPWYKAVFNTGLYTTATFLAGWVYNHLGGMSPFWDAAAVGASLAATILYFLVQNTGVAVVISLSTDRGLGRLWLDSFGWVGLQQAVLGIIGLLLGRSMQNGMTLLGGLLLLSPLFLLRYSYSSFASRIQAYVLEIERVNKGLADLNEELKETNAELIETLGSVLDARDRYTYGHSTQVATYAVALGEKLGLPAEELERLRLAALLHDIGKVGIPETVLFKAGPLDAHERRIMQAHAEIGYRITRQIHSLAGVAEIIRQHHEWWGGGGYPRNLKGEEILLSARIIGVADALDTLISDRPYRKGKPVEVAYQEIRRCSGTQFDPQVAGALEQLIRERGGLWFQNSAYKVTQSALALEVAASMSG
ncbi:MAG: metal dependent phosphohydrolase [Symbiobacteriaceae bacterium]|jgi:putative nucleotidyltransferase with HDIG domain|nr:metal dependent phosphohydrolase [Symbiobacteriaceae bacterium]